MVDKIWYNMEELIGGSEERGINRNILECKVRKSIMLRISRKGINRNILECKGKRYQSHLAGFRVLIETYWNVKAREDRNG